MPDDVAPGAARLPDLDVLRPVLPLEGRRPEGVATEVPSPVTPFLKVFFEGGKIDAKRVVHTGF